MSPSLRGSGLKFIYPFANTLLCIVSLFTREWIEIPAQFKASAKLPVSLFTREWIEIPCFQMFFLEPS